MITSISVVQYEIRSSAKSEEGGSVRVLEEFKEGLKLLRKMKYASRITLYASILGID